VDPSQGYVDPSMGYGVAPLMPPQQQMYPGQMPMY